MSKMFESTVINGMVLSNRFVRSATWEGMATGEGAATPALTEKMTELVNGGVGLIISSHAYVSPAGQAGPMQLGIYKDELIPGLNQMTAAVHDLGGKIVMQLSHAGIVASEKLTGYERLVVSETGEPHCHQMTDQDAHGLIAAFANGARRAKEAGFDGVQIHSAHGYLLSQFLSPAFNRRQDQYGGDIHNRSRILLNVYQAIRKTVGEHYPVLIKLNCQDFIEGGLKLDDSLQVGRMLADAGLDAIELSGGVTTGGKMSPSRPMKSSEDAVPYYLDEAREFKKAINIPLILVGGIRSLNTSEFIINNGIADYISMSRPFIKEPNLINRWESRDSCKSECRSDNRCFRMGLSGNGISCDIKKED